MRIGPHKRLAVLVSGSGTLLKAMLQAGLPMCLVVADRECEGIEIAKHFRKYDERYASLEIVVIDRHSYGYGTNKNWNRKGFSRDVATELNSHYIDVAAMAGFMTILDTKFFEVFTGWLLNIHPALLPKYKGEHAVRDALEAGDNVTGTTIHIATPVLDDARYIVARRTVRIKPDDTEETLHERIKKKERPLYVNTLRAIIYGYCDLSKIYRFRRS